jgi:hypothetical protein
MIFLKFDEILATEKSQKPHDFSTFDFFDIDLGGYIYSLQKKGLKHRDCRDQVL